jgi:hypothetical protein
VRVSARTEGKSLSFRASVSDTSRICTEPLMTSDMLNSTLYTLVEPMSSRFGCPVSPCIEFCRDKTPYDLRRKEQVHSCEECPVGMTSKR